MGRLNNKGFTLVEILAVIVIIGILGGIATVGVVSSINNSKKASYKILVGSIVTAANTLYDEIDNNNFMGGDYVTDLYHYSINDSFCSTMFGCKTDTKIQIVNNGLTVNLQTLVSNGFLDGINNECMDKCSKSGDNSCFDSCSNKNFKILINPKDNKDIGSCSIKITRENNKISVSSLSGKGCPTQSDFDEVLQ